MVMKMLNKLNRRMGGHSDYFTKKIENIIKYQTEVTELKNTITEVKITLGEFNSRLDETEEWIIKLEDKTMELTRQSRKTKNNFKK